MTSRMDDEQLHALMMASHATNETDELTAMVEHAAGDSEAQRWDATVRALDAALALDDAGMRRKVQRLRDTLAAREG